jgi:hypothetical protein
LVSVITEVNSIVEIPLLNEVNLAIFRNYTYKNGLWCRIKYAWWHLKTGQKHKDQMCLSFEKARKLAEFINETTKLTAKQPEL